MAHQIENTDVIFSIKGREWHGLAKHVECITRELIQESVLWPIKTGERILCEVDGETVEVDRNKILFADFRNRTDLPPELRVLTHLHTPKLQYQDIDNGMLFDAMEAARRECGAIVSSVGTLRGGAGFVMSMELDGNGETEICGTRHAQLLNLVSSHDGSADIKPHLSLTRIICANTERWSLQEAEGSGKLVSIRHTGAALERLPNIGKYFELMLGRVAVHREQMEGLAEVKMTEGQMMEFAAGFLATANRVKPGNALSTRSRNAAESIVSLAQTGRGNAGLGLNAYALACGATDYWSTGDGSGMETKGRAAKMFNANFGQAAEHKESFVSGLVDSKERNEVRKIGRAVIKAAAELSA
jgi:hypothetical protein